MAMNSTFNFFFGVLFLVLISLNSAIAQTITPQVQVNHSNSVVLSEEGKVYTFGHNNWGELGQGNINRNDIPGAVDMSNLGGKKIWKIGEGNSSEHQLFITEDSTLAGFGKNNESQLSAAAGGSDTFAPVLIDAPELEGLKIVQAVQGEGYSYVLTDSGHVYFMGRNGDGSTTNFSGTADPSSPITVPTMIDTTSLGGEVIVKISSSANHRLLLGENGTVFGLGENNQGQLGMGNTLRQYVAVPVDMSPFEGKTVVDIATLLISGAAASMVLTSDGSVFTTGSQNNLALGQGDLSQSLDTFTEITHSNLDGKTIIQIAVTGEAGFLLSDDGILFGMGADGSFVRQDGADISSNVPIEILNSDQLDSPIAEVSVGEGNSGEPHFILTTTGGQIFGFGHSGNGQTGTGYTTEYLETPVLLNLSEMQGDSFVQKDGGLLKTFYLDNNGLIYSNGGRSILYNRNEQDGTSFNLMIGRTGIQGVGRPALIDESNLAGKRITGIAAGFQQTFLITEDGEVFGMGQAADGMLGTGDSLDVHIPQKIDHSNLLGKKIIKVATGGNGNVTGHEIVFGHTLLLADDGTVFGFGNNSAGQLGLGDRQRRYIPTELTDDAISGKTIVEIAVNGANSMFIASDGTVLLSGSGDGDHMGFGDTDDRLVPTLQNHPNLDGAHIVRGAVGMEGSVGYPHFIVLSDDHRVFSFGRNTQGQLGQGDIETYNVPTQITSLDGLSIVDVAAGEEASLFRTADGSLYGAGRARRFGFDVFQFATYKTPTLVLGDLEGRRVVDVDVYFGPSIALLDDGTVLTFGAINTSIFYGIYGNGEPRDADHIEATMVEDFSAYKSPIPTENLTLHLDAGRGLTVSNDTLTTWGDLSVANNNGAQPILSQRPIVVDSTINNQRAIRFNGTTSYMVLPTTTALGIQNSDYEMFVVAKSAVATNAIQFLLAGSSENFEIHTNGTSGVRFIPNIDMHVDHGAEGSYTDGNPHMINVRATDTFANATVNRSNSTQSEANARSSDGSELFMGVRQGGTFWFGGDIAEVIIYTVLSDADRGRVEEYLVQKYAITNNIDAAATLTGTEGWRLLASPVADSSYAPLLSNLWTQGFTGAKSPDFGSPNVFTWDTASTGGDAFNWKALEDIDTPFNPGTGALVYVFSDDNYDEPGDAGFPKTLPLSGIEPLGEQDLNPQLNANNEGWALLGNPFRYDISWDAFSKKNLSNAVYMYDNNSAGWKTWNGATGSLTDGKIGAFNGFFVQTMGSEPELSIPDSAKTYVREQFMGKKQDEEPVYTFSLKVSHEEGLFNSGWFQFSKKGSASIDAYDAHKLVSLNTSYLSLGSVLNDSTTLDINSLPLNGDPVEIPLQLKTTESGSFTISKADMNIPEDWKIELIDTQTGKSSDLKSGYRFTVDQPAAKTAPKDLLTSSFPMKSVSDEEAEPRFLLKILPGLSTGNEDPDMPKEINLSQNYPNPFNPSTVIRYQLPVNSEVRLEVFDLIGRKVSTLVDGQIKAGFHSVTFNAQSLASGMYIYRLQAGNSVFTKKLTIIK